jgi:hypothetical protein
MRDGRTLTFPGLQLPFSLEVSDVNQACSLYAFTCLITALRAQPVPLPIAPTLQPSSCLRLL